uniref:S41 family peptidase n=1 Tax=Acetatifactor sp. TaxID=1872090 RepID=UPI004057ABD1
MGQWKESCITAHKRMEDNRDNNYYDYDSLKKKETVPQKDKGQNGLFFGGIVVGVTGALLVICLVFLGVKMQEMLGRNANGIGANDIEFDADSAITPQMVNKLQLLEETIDRYYYLEEVTDETLDDGIYKGLLMALGDPYSEYYTTEELNALLEQSEGIYYGIGAYVSLDTISSLPKISGIIDGAPAAEVDLRPNDLIYMVDGVETYGMDLTEAVSMIKGKEGTEVVLTIVRDGEEDYLEIPVTRRKVESPTVEFEMLDDETAYIQIVEFDDITIDQFADALATAKGSGMKGLILDLRANPGGSLNAVVEIARMMLPEGMIVYTEDKYGKSMEYTCDGKRQLDVPLVVLIDMNSASASEILAGAIKDYGIGTLVGTTSYGKGIVQQVIPFSDGSAVKLTISSYYTPNGNNIHGIGVEPDIECEFDGEAYYDEENPYDNQLEKAKEVLRDLMGQ